MEYCQWNYTFNCQVISRQNTWNNFIDQKISDTHNDNDASIVTLATLHLINIKYVWDSRKFIAQTSLVKGFKSFFNLSRNTKYRRNNVEWESTFFLLSCDESSNTTSFQASALKAQKLKNFLQLNRWRKPS